MKAQSVWNFGVMTQESWVAFARVSEDLVTVALPQGCWGQLGVSLSNLTVDEIWEVFIAMLQSAAKKVIPQRRVGGEPRPPKEEVPINRGLHLLGSLLRKTIALPVTLGHSYNSRLSLEKVYLSLQALFTLPELQVMLQTVGLTALPDLPLIDLNQTSGWQVFRKTIRSLWVSLRLARITQHNLTRAELIRTCVQ
jgi:hypothetical protein